MTAEVTQDSVAELGPEARPVPHPRHNDVLGGLPGSGLSPGQGSPRTRLPGRRKTAWSSNLAAASASRHSTDPLLCRVWPVGRGPQGTVGPLLQPEGQSCFPGAAWLHRRRLPAHVPVAPAPGLRTWGWVLPIHSLTSSVRAGPCPSPGLDSCTEEETQAAARVSPVAAGVSSGATCASRCCWHRPLSQSRPHTTSGRDCGTCLFRGEN